MPSHEMGMNSAQSHQRLNDSDIPEIRVKTAYNGQVYITYIDHSITYPLLMSEMKGICGFGDDQDLTVKWVDEEGDPCVIQSQTELDEAIRLYEVNKDAEFSVHVFPGVPPSPGQPCYGEDRSIYRRGARRWRKMYKVNGHIFQVGTQFVVDIKGWVLITYNSTDIREHGHEQHSSPQFTRH